jgi:hypothetical protein
MRSLIILEYIDTKPRNGEKVMKKLHLKAALIAGATIAMLMSGCSSKAGTGAAIGGGTGALV